MKLLLDENLSRHLLRPLSQIYDEIEHVVYAGLMQSDDQSIWNYPRAKGLVIVSKDADFAERSFLHGHPPKVVWIRTGNWSKLEMQRLLSDALPKIEAFAGSS